MYDPTGKTDRALASLEGLWVGDCIGNIGQLYFAHDILKALDEGMMKLHQSEKDALNSVGTKNRFQYSDDTEEAIVLVNHIVDNYCNKIELIQQDNLAKEFAKRYYERDPDGEIFGYGLMTRKVLKDIYDGVDWRVANQTKPRMEGSSFVDKMLGGIVGGKSINQSMAEVNAEMKEQMKKSPELKVGSCGNGSAMRVAPLGSFCFDVSIEDTIKYATLQSEVTHCHPEGIAGAIAVTLLAREFAKTKKMQLDGYVTDTKKEKLYQFLLTHVPKSQVWDGIKRASELPLDTPIATLQTVLGNGTHVTCQDTVPICVFLSVKAITSYHPTEAYEKTIIETCKCFGDVDTNCAIVGGIIGSLFDVPEKWKNYCQEMEGVLGEPFPEKPRKSIQSRLGFDINKQELNNVLNNTTPWGGNLGIGNSTEKDWDRPINYVEGIKIESIPSFNEMIEERFKQVK